MEKIRRLLALRGSDRRLLVIASIRLVAVTLVLRWLGFRWIAGWLQLLATRPGLADIARARRYAAWVEAAARCLPIRTRCLARSVALHWWLRSEGAVSELRIGVAKRGHTLQAHAWVELGGAPVNATTAELAPFTPLETIGSGRIEACHQAGGQVVSRYRRASGAGRRMVTTGIQQ